MNFNIRECNQKFVDWTPGARTANGTAFCHQVQLYRYFVSQSSESCHHNTSYCLSTSVYCCKRIFRYRPNPETFGYTFIYCAPNIIRVIKSRRMTWAGHVARMGTMGNARKILIGKYEGGSPLG
jgi:hypothetical protein